MRRNPAYGKWQSDDAFPDQCGKVENDHLTSRGTGASLWDLNCNGRKIIPCTVTVGQFTIKDVIFPKRKDTAKRIRRQAEEAILAYGLKNNPSNYLLPRRISKRLVPLYRYYLAKSLTEK